MKDKRKLPIVSIIICTKNEEKRIKNCLENVLSTHYRNKEIIVVDSSTDNTPKIAKKFPIKLIRDTKGPLGHSRNLGWKIARGKYICYIDADMQVPSDFIQKMIEKFNEDIGVGIVGCRKFPLKKGWLANCDSLSLHLSKLQWIMLIGQPKSVECGGSIYLKTMLQKLGGFNEKLRTMEDAELSSRARKNGLKIHYNLNTYCYNEFPISPFEWFCKITNAEKRKFFIELPIAVLGILRSPFLCIHGLLATREKISSLLLIIYYPFKWIATLFKYIIR